MKPEREKGKIMNLMNQIIATEPAITPKTIALRIKQQAPTLDALSQDQLEQLAKYVMHQRLADQLNAEVNLAGINWQKEKDTFLANAGREKSKHTRLTYSAGLKRLEAYADRIKLNLLGLTPMQADDFIYSLQTDGRAPASVRSDVTACSSFFTFLERRHEGLKNPFRGTKARPAKKASRKTEIPSAEEVKTILASLPAVDKAMVSVMVSRGLRAGALPTLSLVKNRYTAHSKGKDIAGTLPPEALDAIKAAGLDGKKPFAGYTPNAVDCRIKYQLKKLYKAGKIQAAYSCHDFRHFYAVTLYRETKDIHKVSKLLDHASIQVTETYLKGLGEYDTE